jgi:hypothetical protein
VRRISDPQAGRPRGSGPGTPVGGASGVSSTRNSSKCRALRKASGKFGRYSIEELTAIRRFVEDALEMQRKMTKR